MLTRASDLARACFIIDDALDDRIHKLCVDLEEEKNRLLNLEDTEKVIEISQKVYNISSDIDYYAKLKSKIGGVIILVKDYIRDLKLDEKELTTIKNIKLNLKKLMIGETTWHTYTEDDIYCISELLNKIESDSSNND